MAADRLDRQSEHPDNERSEDHGHQHAGPGWAPPMQQENQCRRSSAHHQGERIKRIDCREKYRKFRQQGTWLRDRHSQPAEVFQLACENRDGDPAGEADGDGMRDIRMSAPARSAPIAVSIRPDSMTVSSRPSTPKLATVAATKTMKAPAGPPIWN